MSGKSETEIKKEFGGRSPESQNRPSLRKKHLEKLPAKFNGQKRKASNSGGTGRAGRRKQRGGGR